MLALRRIDHATGASTTTPPLTYGGLGFSIVPGPNGEIWTAQYYPSQRLKK